MIAVRHRILRCLALALLALAVGTGSAASAAAHPHIVFVRCSAVPFPCASHTIVTRAGYLLVGAKAMSPHAKVSFTIRLRNGRAAQRAVGGKLRTRTRIVVPVPGNAISGP